MLEISRPIKHYLNLISKEHVLRDQVLQISLCTQQIHIVIYIMLGLQPTFKILPDGGCSIIDGRYT